MPQIKLSEETQPTDVNVEAVGLGITKLRILSDYAHKSCLDMDSKLSACHVMRESHTCDLVCDMNEGTHRLTNFT